MACFAFDAALKDLEKFYKSSSMEKDRPSVGFVTCGSRAKVTWPVHGCAVGGRAAEKNIIHAATIFKELHFIFFTSQ